MLELGNVKRNLLNLWVTNFSGIPSPDRIDRLARQFKNFEDRTKTKEFRDSHPDFVPGNIHTYRDLWIERLGGAYRIFMADAVDSAHRAGVTLSIPTIEAAALAYIDDIAGAMLNTVLDDIEHRAAHTVREERREAREQAAVKKHLKEFTQKREAAIAARVQQSSEVGSIDYSAELQRSGAGRPTEGRLNAGETRSMVQAGRRDGLWPIESVRALANRGRVESVFRNSMVF